MKPRTAKWTIFFLISGLVGGLVLVYNTCDNGLSFAVAVVAAVLVFAFSIPPLCKGLDECKDPLTPEEILIESLESLIESNSRPRVIKIIPPPPTPRWKCGYCGALGAGSVGRCGSCGAPRE